MQVYENYFSGTTACDRYKKKIPQAVKDDYMAGEVEIFETAQRLVKKYKQSQQFRYVLVKRPQIRETDRRKLQVDLLVRKNSEIRGLRKEKRHSWNAYLFKGRRTGQNAGGGLSKNKRTSQNK